MTSVSVDVGNETSHTLVSLVAQWVKNPPASAGDARDVGSLLGQEDLLE